MESQNHVLAAMDMAQVGVRTRAQAALAMEAAATSPASTSKRRKIKHTDEQRKNSTKSRTRAADVEPEKTAVIPVTVTEERCSSPTSDEFPASCCSSNGSVGLDEERIKLLDLEVESAQVETSTCNCGEEIERREMSYSSKVRENSQELESVETNCRRSAVSTAQTMPTELELEEFFATAEKDIHKKFQDKYNYDVVKDVPLEGRYEWVQLKP